MLAAPPTASISSLHSTSLGAAEDKRERRRKLGLPEEPTPEELAAKATQEAAAAAKKDAQRLKDILPVKPVSGAFQH